MLTQSVTQSVTQLVAQLARWSKLLGPGLMFASISIGTSHLVLSTRAGAHHGLMMIIVIALVLLLKYPFFQMGPRYALATGHSLLSGYLAQGKSMVILFIAIIAAGMFAVTGAVAAVCASLLGALIDRPDVFTLPALMVGVLTISAGLLWAGGYVWLDKLIKLISVILLLTVSIAFVMALTNGGVGGSAPELFGDPRELLAGAGFVALIGLVGWMPSGIEASAVNSIWVLEKMRASKQRVAMQEGLFDFNFGYAFTAVTAVMFATIGVLTIYGSGQSLEGGSMQVADQLINIFAVNIGPWAYWVVAIAALGTMYGTLLTVLDAFARGFLRGVFLLRTGADAPPPEISYRVMLVVIVLGSVALSFFFRGGMIQMVQFSTTLGFLVAPLMAWLNLRSTLLLPREHQPSPAFYALAYVGLAVLASLALYHISTYLFS